MRFGRDRHLLLLDLGMGSTKIKNRVPTLSYWHYAYAFLAADGDSTCGAAPPIRRHLTAAAFANSVTQNSKDRHDLIFFTIDTSNQNEESRPTAKLSRAWGLEASAAFCTASTINPSCGSSALTSGAARHERLPSTMRVLIPRANRDCVVLLLSERAVEQQKRLRAADDRHRPASRRVMSSKTKLSEAAAQDGHQVV